MTAQWIYFCFLLIGVTSIHTAYAEDSSQDWYKQAEIQNHEFQLQMEKSALELKRMELEQLKMDAESKERELDSARLNAETEQLIMLYKATAREKELNERMEQAEQALEEQENVAREAEEAADEMRSQIEQADVRHKNYFYLGTFVLTVTILVLKVVKKSKNEVIMKDYEKYGIVIILSSTLLILFSLIISEHWVERYDFIQNLMTALRISLFAEEEDCTYRCSYMIDFPTKYAVLLWLNSASYGFTTYLGITPAYKINLFSKSDKSIEKS